MTKPLKRAAIILISCLVLLLLIALLNWRRPADPYFSPPPIELTLRVLGNATNYLKLDHQHNWQTFSVSNGTSKTLFYTVTQVEYRAPDGWRSAGSWFSNTLTNASLMTRRETPGEIPSGTTDVFYATIPVTNIPWRLRVGCFEANWSQPVDAAVGNLTEKLKGLPPSNTKVWSGPRYELISEQIPPD